MHGYAQIKMLSSFNIFIDTREQKNERAERRYIQFGVGHTKCALSTGDYTYDAVLPSGRHIVDQTHGAITAKCVIERKMDVNELIGCFVGTKKKQFKNELQRAKEAGTKFYLLVENTTWEDIFAHRYRSQTEPDVVLANLNAIQARYDVHLIFCPEEYSGRLIKEILYRELKERLQNGDFD